MSCSIAGALEAIGERWAFLIIRDLCLGLRRYDDLQASTGISNSSLTDRLTHLETQGLVERRLYQERPRRFEYHLTPKGRDLSVVMLALAAWGDRWDAAGKGAAPVEFFDVETGGAVQIKVVEAASGEPVPTHRVAARPGPGADERVRWRIERGLQAHQAR